MGLEVDGPRKVPRLRKKAASILPKDCKLGDWMDTPPWGEEVLSALVLMLFVLNIMGMIL